MPLVRLKLVDRSDDFDHLFVDVFVDEFGAADDRLMTYGRWGQLSKEPWPLILRPRRGSAETNVDFGTGMNALRSSEERFATTNLLSKRIMVGELATFSYGGDEICFQVVEAKIMPDGDDFRPA